MRAQPKKSKTFSKKRSQLKQHARLTDRENDPGCHLVLRMDYGCSSMNSVKIIGS